MPRAVERACWYDLPELYDLAMRDETPAEVRFLTGAARRFARGPVRSWLELGCGSGRLVAALAARGYRVIGLDRSQPALEYLRGRLRRRGLRARLWQADMQRFALDRPVDAACCTFDSFRHLLSEDAACEHLRCVARAVRPGGVYVLGFHLLPPDADDACTERWTAERGPLRLSVTLRVLQTDHRRRLETIRISLLARRGGQERRVRDEFLLRRYTAGQFRRLLAGVPQWELQEVFDFWYELDHPVPLDDQLSDAVFVLRRVE
jgi:SAM-dependent methyltransferase